MAHTWTDAVATNAFVHKVCCYSFGQPNDSSFSGTVDTPLGSTLQEEEEEEEEVNGGETGGDRGA